MDKREANARRILYSAVLRTAVCNGEIIADGKTDDELEEEFNEYFYKLGSRNLSLLALIDHRPDILTAARAFKQASNYQLSCLLYATWAEHCLNAIIGTLAKRNSLREDDIREMIRDVPLKGKMTWLVRALGGPPISQKHQLLLARIAESRNCFVHYKWKPIDFEDAARPNQHLKDLLVEFEKTVRYLLRYESQYLLRSKSGMIRRFSKSCAD